jgi:hypothetical protein
MARLSVFTRFTCPSERALAGSQRSLPRLRGDEVVEGEGERVGAAVDVGGDVVAADPAGQAEGLLCGD